MKFLVFSDIHFHDFKGGVALSDISYCFKLLCKKAHKEGVQYILFPGDLIHQKDGVPKKVLNEVMRCFFWAMENTGIEILAVSGNHDHGTINTYREGPTAETVLETFDMTFDRFHLLDMKGKDLGGIYVYGIPYFEHAEDFDMALKNAPDPEGYGILLTHQTPDKATGAAMMGPGMRVKDVAGWDLVLNGHVHLKEQLGTNFYDVGAPYQQNFGDKGTDKGFWLLEVDNGGHSMEFRTLNHKMPVFHEIREDEELPEGHKKGDIVRRVPRVEYREDEAEVDTGSDDSGEIIESYIRAVEDKDPSIEEKEIEDTDRLIETGKAYIQ